MKLNIDTDLFPLKNQRILDVGAARGEISSELAQCGARVTALEFELELLKALELQAKEHGFTAMKGDARKLDLSEKSFDGAVMLEVFEHIDDSKKVLSELHRVLQPDGKLVLSVPTGYSERLYSFFFRDYQRQATHIHTFDKSTLTQLLQSAGFSVTTIKTANFEPFVAWIFHALLHSKADATGQILEHHWVGRWVSRVYGVCRRLPLVKLLLAWIENHVGKSWYVYAEK
jgi:2-polyprenyl-3-methyl-5-hydroxy-6-metoxy-1,4-benzoquinol methylase